MVVVLIGYGEEEDVYRFCRKVWELYVTTSDIKDLKYFFVKEKNDQYEEVSVNANEMYIKVDDSWLREKLLQGSKLISALPSDWSATLNFKQTIRAKKSLHWVLENFGDACTHTFQTTITSIHEMDSLIKLVNALPRTGVYAGGMNTYSQTLFTDGPFTFASGSNTILSNDLMVEVVANSIFDHLLLPFDALTGLILKRAKKIEIPRCDIEKPVVELMSGFDVTGAIDSAFDFGHFHFRVKSKGDRSKTDHLVLLEVYKKISQGLKPEFEKLLGLCRYLD